MTEELLGHNDAFASDFDKGDLPMPPGKKVAVLACMDARLDPAKVLGLDEGDAHVVRNAGGTPRGPVRLDADGRRVRRRRLADLRQGPRQPEAHQHDQRQEGGHRLGRGCVLHGLLSFADHVTIYGITDRKTRNRTAPPPPSRHRRPLLVGQPIRPLATASGRLLTPYDPGP